MSEPAPSIDNREFKALVEEFREYAPFYTPEWNANNEDDAGVALSKIFSHIMTYVIDRLNKVPRRNFIAFLNMLGTRLSPAQPAKADVTFTLAEGIKHDVLVNAGTKLATVATEEHDALSFETIETTLLTRAKVVEVFSAVDGPSNDAIYSHTADFVQNLPFFVFEGKDNIQKHALFLAHAELFKIKKDSKIILDITCNDAKTLLNALENAQWEYNWRVDPDTGLEVASKLYASQMKLVTKSSASSSTSISGASPPLVLKRCQIVLSFAKSGAVEFMGGSVHNQDETVVLELAPNPPDAAPDVWLSSSTDAKGVQVVMDQTGPHTGIFMGEITLTSTEESSASANPQKLQVKEGNVLIATYRGQISIASVLNAKDKWEIEERELQGINSRWIRCIISPSNFISQRKLIESMVIDDIQVHTEPELGAYKPAMLFYNDIPIQNTGNFSDPVYPFGEKPQTFDTFYAASDVFSKKNASIRFSFSCDSHHPLIKPRIPDSSRPYPILSWEYWNGKAWANIIYVYDEVVSEGLDDKIYEQSIRFRCPQDMSPCQVNGTEGYWIRARIARGDYGKEILISSGDPPVYRPSSLDIHPPKIFDLSLSYAMPPKHLQNCITYNNLGYHTDVMKADGTLNALKPFFGLEVDIGGSFYLGFDNKLEKGPINVYLSLDELEITEEKEPSVNYFYCSVGGGWNRLEVLDDTKDMSKAGYVRFLMPPDFGEQEIFGRKLHWIKAVDTKGRFTPSMQRESSGEELHPRAKAVRINTIPALNTVRVDDENLGTSNGEKNQIFKFAKTPVTTSGKLQTKVWINETKFIAEDEKELLRKNGETHETKDKSGNVVETWILWNEVSDIFLSGPDDRHFELDSALGELRFGDGLFGKVPPPGKDIIKSSYGAGGGSSGNVRTGEINSLKSPVPFVDSLVNPEAAGGGMDTETIEKAMERGPQIVKHRGQAVTTEDFEWIIKERFPSVAKVKCLPTTWTKGEFRPGHVVVIIVPSSMEERPEASFELLSRVEQYLKERSSNVVVALYHLKVLRPIYARVSVTADIFPNSLDEAPAAEKLAYDNLVKFLHPIFGATNGKGWDFGKIVCFSDIYSILEGIHEIDHVENLSLEIELEGGDRMTCSKINIMPNDTAATITVPPHSLIYSGSHILTLRFSLEDSKSM